VLRTVDAHFTSVAGNQQWRDYVLEQARKVQRGTAVTEAAATTEGAATATAATATAATPAAAAGLPLAPGLSSLIEAARDYAALVENVAAHRALLREYNIGIDPDERNRQMVEKTAARVGFSMPKARAPPADDDDDDGAGDEGAADGPSGGRAGGGRPSVARRAALARAAAAADSAPPPSKRPARRGGGAAAAAAAREGGADGKNSDEAR